MISKTYAADIQAFYPQLRLAACADVLPESARCLNVFFQRTHQQAENRS